MNRAFNLYPDAVFELRSHRREGIFISVISTSLLDPSLYDSKIKPEISLWRSNFLLKIVYASNISGLEQSSFPITNDFPPITFSLSIAILQIQAKKFCNLQSVFIFFNSHKTVLTYVLCFCALFFSRVLYCNRIIEKRYVLIYW